jgi:hypothetical protein
MTQNNPQPPTPHTHIIDIDDFSINHKKVRACYGTQCDWEETGLWNRGGRQYNDGQTDGRILNRTLKLFFGGRGAETWGFREFPIFFGNKVKYVLSYFEEKEWYQRR